MGLLEAIVKVVVQLLCGSEKPPKQEYPVSHAGAQQPHHPATGYPPASHHKPPQNQYQPSPPHAHAGGRPPRPLDQRIDENQVNQRNEQYLDLRKRANQEGDAMARAFDESQKAYKGGDGARAKQLSEEGKRHKAEMERLNRQAADWIYYANNTDSAPNEIDLHGLYVKEAIERTEQAIEAAQQRGDPNIHLIVGKGLHSEGQVAKIKPAIETLITKYQLAAQLDPQNTGVLIVQLNGQRRGEKGMGVDEISHRLEKDDACIIM